MKFHYTDILYLANIAFDIYYQYFLSQKSYKVYIGVHTIYQFRRQDIHKIISVPSVAHKDGIINENSAGPEFFLERDIMDMFRLTQLFFFLARRFGTIFITNHCAMHIGIIWECLIGDSYLIWG